MKSERTIDFAGLIPYLQAQKGDKGLIRKNGIVRGRKKYNFDLILLRRENYCKCSLGF